MVKFQKFIGAGKPGCLCAHNQTTPVIEVAGDGKTAKGVMLSYSPFAVYGAHKHVLKCRQTGKDSNQLKRPGNAPFADLMGLESN